MPMNDERLRNRLGELRLEFLRRLPERFDAAQAAVDSLACVPAPPEALRTAYRHFHSLAGSGGTYGFDALSRLARLGESLLKSAFEGSRPLLESDFRYLRELLAELRNVESPTIL